MLDTIECDLYLKLIESTNDITASLHCRDLMKDSATKVTLINPRYNDESDVVLGQDEMIWIEVAETPKSLRAKLLQLERAVRYFEYDENSIIGRGAVMVCLNGEKSLFDRCLKHLKGLYRDGKLEDWRIFAKKVPLFVTYTPYRNVYKSIADVTDRLNAFETKVDTRLDAFETKLEARLEAVETEIKTTLKAVETEVAEIKTILKAIDTKLDMIINALNANRPQQSDTGADLEEKFFPISPHCLYRSRNPPCKADVLIEHGFCGCSFCLDGLCRCCCMTQIMFFP